MGKGHVTQVHKQYGKRSLDIGTRQYWNEILEVMGGDYITQCWNETLVQGIKVLE